MTTYAIGDVQGRFQTLLQLLEKIRFNRSHDTLWFTGNLVNSGPDSLEVLRFVKNLGKQAVTVLGDQEMRLLTIAEDVEPQRPEDAFDEILAAPDRNELLKWLRQRPFLHYEANFTLVHAGIPAEWSLSQAQTFAMEAEFSLSMGNHKSFLENIAGDDPSRWHAKHRGWKRLRFITNALTRMCYCNEKGRLDYNAKESHETLPQGYVPWYRLAGRAMANQNIIFGHWGAPNDEYVPGIFPLEAGGTRNGSLSALEVCSSPEKITISST